MGVRAAGAWGSHDLHVPNVLEIWELKPPGTLLVTLGLLRDSFTFHCPSCPPRSSQLLFLPWFSSQIYLRLLRNLKSKLNEIYRMVYKTAWLAYSITQWYKKNQELLQNYRRHKGEIKQETYWGSPHIRRQGTIFRHYVARDCSPLALPPVAPVHIGKITQKTE